MLRTGKEKWAVGVVVKRDFDGESKRVKFHFPKLHIKFDEWVDISSPRLATLYSKTDPQKDSSKSVSNKPKNGEISSNKQADKERRWPSLATSSSHQVGKQHVDPMKPSTFEDQPLPCTDSAPIRPELSHGRLSPVGSRQIHNEYSDQMYSNSYSDPYGKRVGSEGTSEYEVNSGSVSYRDDGRYDHRAESGDDLRRRVPRKGEAPRRTEDSMPKGQNDRMSSYDGSLAPSTSDPTRVPRKSHTSRNQFLEPSTSEAADHSYYDPSARKDSMGPDYPSRHADLRPHTSSSRQTNSDGQSHSVLRDDNLVSERSNWRDSSVADNVANDTYVPWKPRRKFRQELHLSSYYLKKENREWQDTHEQSEIHARRSQMSSPPSPRRQADFQESSFRHVDSNTEDGGWRDQYREATEFPRNRRDSSPPRSRIEDHHETTNIPRRRDYSPPPSRQEHHHATRDIPRTRRDYSPPPSRQEPRYDTIEIPRRRDYSPPASRGEHHRQEIELPRSRRDYSPPSHRDSSRQDQHQHRRDYSPPPSKRAHHRQETEISHKRDYSPPRSREDRHHQDIMVTHQRDYSPASKQDWHHQVPRSRRDYSPPPSPRRKTDSFRDHGSPRTNANGNGWRESTGDYQNSFGQHGTTSPSRRSADRRFLEENNYESREMERATEIPAGRPSSRSPPNETANPLYLDEAPPEETADPRSLDEEEEDYADGDLELGEVTEDAVGRSDLRSPPKHTTLQSSSYRSSDYLKPEDRARQISRSDSPGYREERHYRSSRDNDHRRDRSYSSSGDDRLRTDSTEFAVRRPHDTSDYRSGRRSTRTRDEDISYADSSDRYSAQRQLELGRTFQGSTSSRRETSPRHRSRDEGGSPRGRSEVVYDDDDRRYRDSNRYSSHRQPTHERTSPSQKLSRNSPNRREPHYENAHRSPSRSYRNENGSYSREGSPSKSSRRYESHHRDAHYRSSPSYRGEKVSPSSRGREGSPNKSSGGHSMRSSSYDSNGDHNNKRNVQQKSGTTGATEEGLFRGDIAKRFKLAPTVDPSIVSSFKGEKDPPTAAREN